MSRARGVATLAIALVLAVGLAGCASIPLSTIWKMRNFSAASLAAIDPAQVRVGVLVEPGSGRIDPGKSTLQVTLTPKEGAPEVHRFGLQRARVQGGAVVPGGDPRWQVLQLDAAGATAMRALMPRFEHLERDYSGWTLNVGAGGMDPPPAGTQFMFISIRVQLADDQDPIVLFDRAKVAMEPAG